MGGSRGGGWVWLETWVGVGSRMVDRVQWYSVGYV